MQYEIAYRPIADLPKLAWLACLNFATGKLTVLHGSAVECRDNWMVEGVWDDDFSRGDFHRSEHFFGTGIRVGDDCVHFVPSTALVDRLLYCIHDQQMLVSNSLIVLLAFTGATLDNTHDYRKESDAILKGINCYDKSYRIVHPTIKEFFQVFHENIVVKGANVSFQVRTQVYEIDSFAHYHRLLDEALNRIKDNYKDPSRRTGLEAFTTVSSGYDSPAVSTLVKKIGVSKCFVWTRSSSPVPGWISKSFAMDDGRPIAKVLTLEAIDLGRHVATSREVEPYFYAVDPVGAEHVFCSMASHIQKHCSAAIVFTGYHGDKVWDANLASQYVNSAILRGDISGLRLAEARLRSGFINVAVPFIHSRSLKSIYGVSRSDEMAPWRLNNSYDRPIPRRIVESAGIDRQLFGIRKKMVSDNVSYPSNPVLRRQFRAYLRHQVKIRPGFIDAQRTANRLIYYVSRLFTYGRYFIRFKTLSPSPTSVMDWKTQSFRIGKEVEVSRLLFLWSVDLLRRGTVEIFQRNPNVEETRPFTV